MSTRSNVPLADAFLATLSRLLPAARPVALHEPRFAGREWDYVKECLDTGWVSTAGAYVGRFESMLAEIHGRPAVAVVNGTAALQLCLQLAGVGPGDEVLVPALTFVATANAVHHGGAVPHFVDSDLDTMGIDPRALAAHLAAVAEISGGACRNRRSGRRIAAVVPMHVFGHPVDMEALTALAADWRLAVIEDATEALGSRRHGRPCGSLAPLAALSFNGNKIITTGGGGALLLADPRQAEEARHLATTAKLAHPWAFVHDRAGYNYRLPNLNAALGCAQLEQLDGFVAAKRALAQRYLDAFPTAVKEPAGCRSNYWLNAVLLADGSDRDGILDAAHEEGLQLRPAWTLMHRLPMYADCPRMALPVAEMLERRLINLPSSAGLA